jgi:hypothetical protein
MHVALSAQTVKLPLAGGPDCRWLIVVFGVIAVWKVSICGKGGLRRLVGDLGQARERGVLSVLGDARAGGAISPGPCPWNRVRDRLKR